MNLLDALINADAIMLQQRAKNWKEAVGLATAPLVKAQMITDQYPQAIIKNVLKNGPYFIISPQVAMPHARPEDGVLKDSFSLVTLQEPVFFPGDKRPIKLLIALAATSADIHTTKALPQIVALLEEEKQVEALIKAKTKDEVIALIKKVNLNKYL